MNPEQAKQLLLTVVNEGRIMLNNQALSGREIAQAQQAIFVLYEEAKNRDEAEEEKKPVPPQEKKK